MASGDVIRNVLIRARFELERPTVGAPSAGAVSGASGGGARGGPRTTVRDVTDLDRKVAQAGRSAEKSAQSFKKFEDSVRNAGIRGIRGFNKETEQALTSGQKLFTRLNESSIRAAEGFRQATEGAARFGRGLAFTLASSEQDLQRWLRLITQIQGVFDVVTGGTEIVTGLQKNIRAARIAALASQQFQGSRRGLTGGQIADAAATGAVARAGIIAAPKAAAAAGISVGFLVSIVGSVLAGLGIPLALFVQARSQQTAARQESARIEERRRRILGVAAERTIGRLQASGRLSAGNVATQLQILQAQSLAQGGLSPGERAQRIEALQRSVRARGVAGIQAFRESVEARELIDPAVAQREILSRQVETDRQLVELQKQRIQALQEEAQLRVQINQGLDNQLAKEEAITRGNLRNARQQQQTFFQQLSQLQVPQISRLVELQRQVEAGGTGLPLLFQLEAFGPIGQRIARPARERRGRQLLEQVPGAEALAPQPLDLPDILTQNLVDIQDRRAQLQERTDELLEQHNGFLERQAQTLTTLLQQLQRHDQQLADLEQQAQGQELIRADAFRED